MRYGVNHFYDINKTYLNQGLFTSCTYFLRNEALYKQSDTSTTKAPTTSTTTTTTTVAPPVRKSPGGRRRRPPYRRRRPVYEYYYDDEYDDEYYDEEEELPPPRKHSGRRHHPRNQSINSRKDDTTSTTTTNPITSQGDAPLTRAPLSVYAPRALPKIKRPVPINEKSKYDYTTKPSTNIIKPTMNPHDVADGEYEDEDVDGYYYDEEDYEDVPPRAPTYKKQETGNGGRRRIHQQERKRPTRYDYYDEEEGEEDERPRMRKRNRKGGSDDDYSRSRTRPTTNKKNRKGSYHRDEDFEPIPSERPGYISGRIASRKRYHSEKPKKNGRWQSEEYDYEDDEEDDNSRYHEAERRRPTRNKYEKPRQGSAKKIMSSTSTTTTTTSTTTTTPKPIPPEIPSMEGEDEYEEYDEPYSEELSTKVDNNKTVPSTPRTSEPHRFSTPNYKNITPTFQTTTEAITRQKTQPVTYRRTKLDFRRTTNKPLDTFPPSNIPSGFVKPVSDVRVKQDEGSVVSRRPHYTYGDTQAGRKLIKHAGTMSSAKAEETDVVTKEVNGGINNQGRKEQFRSRTPSFDSPRPLDVNNVKVPIKLETHSNDGSYQQNTKFVIKDNIPVNKPPNLDFPVPITSFERRPSNEYRTFPRAGIFTPTAPDNVGQVYRRPSGSSLAESNRRPNEGIVIRKPFKQDTYSTLPQSLEEDYMTSFKIPYNKEEEAKQEEQTNRPIKQDSTLTFDHLRRATDGMPITAAGFRRIVRPNDSDRKNTETIAYPARRTKEPQTTTIEPSSEVGPNYRNPFSFPRPVKEDNDYFKPPKAVEFTAPGPSGEGSTERSLPIYDIDEEYDVTLNDALQPSTLNPTLQYGRVKSRGYQSSVTHPSYHSLILPSASQTFYTLTSAQNGQEDYGSVVLPAARFPQTRYKQQRQPAESYW